MSIRSRISAAAGRLLKWPGAILRSHTRPAVACLGALGLIVCLLVVLGVVSYQRRHPKAAPPPPLADLFSPLPIPPEELFMPDEPDFLPEVLWERAPRESWTPEDALPFWTDPLDNNRRVWEGRVEGMIDELLERLP